MSKHILWMLLQGICIYMCSYVHCVVRVVNIYIVLSGKHEILGSAVQFSSP